MATKRRQSCISVLDLMAQKIPRLGRFFSPLQEVRSQLAMVFTSNILWLQQRMRKVFLILNGSLYIARPKARELRRFEHSEIFDAGLVKTWIRLSPKSILSRETQVMSAFPTGRLGNRFFELSLLIAFGGPMSDRLPIMLHKKLQGDEALIAPFLRSAPVLSFESNKKSLRILNEVGHAQVSPRILQVNFLETWPRAALESAKMSASFDILRSGSRQRLTSLTGKDSVVIHFRGTDRLTSRQDPQFGPAPLSFFVKAARHSGASQSLIVTDDPQSSILKDLVKRLRAAGIGTSIQSRSLREDFEALLTGSTLILSGSSLGDSAAGLSDCLQSVYVFQRALPTRRKLGVQITEMYDRSGLWDAGLERIEGSFQEGIGKLMREIPQSQIHPRN